MKRFLSTALSFLIVLSVFITPFNTVLAEEESGIAAVEFENAAIDNYSVAIGFSKRIYVIGSSVGDEECSWATSDEGIVALASSGRLETNEHYIDISGVSEGTATISAAIGEKTYSLTVSSYMSYDGEITGKTLGPAPIFDSAGQSKKFRFNIPQDENLRILGSCGDLYKVAFLERTPNVPEYDTEFYTIKSAVRINITNLIFDTPSTSMNVGESKKLGLTVLPALASNAVSWFSSNDSVATVNNGTVTAISPGSVVIRAYSTTNDVDAVMNVSVYKAATELTYGDIPDQYFCGDFIAPDVEVKDGDKTLEKGRDFDVEYNDNLNVGTASISVYFKNYYSGTHVINFNIIEQDINSAFEIEDIPDQTFTGDPLSPDPIITCNGKLMVLGEHYYLTFNNNVYTGTATVIITGKNGFVGSIEKTFDIVPLDGNDSQIKIEVKDAVFTNEEKTPLVRVFHNDNRLIKGSDYTLEYSDNIKIGMGRVTISFIGNYSGTRTKYFYIKPPKGEILLDGENSFDGTLNSVFLSFKGHYDDSNVTLYYELYRDDEYVCAYNRLTYDDYDLSDYEIHEYKMRMFFVDDSNEKHYGEWSDTVKLGTAPSNVKIEKITTTVNADGKTSQATIKVSGVGKQQNVTVYYELWRYSANYNTANVQWEMLKADCSTATYVDTTTVVGSRYLYEIRPYYYIQNTNAYGGKYNIKIYGDFTESQFTEAPLPTVTNFKVTYNDRTGEAYFTWSKIATATDYMIVVYYDGEGHNSQYGYNVGSNDNKYTLKCENIVPNRQYVFRILAYNKSTDNYSNPSAKIDFISQLPIISITKLATGASGILVTTDYHYKGERIDLKVEYWVATSDSGPFKLKATLNPQVACYEYGINCERDKKYYIKLRAKYSEASGIYGGYSAVKTIEVGPQTPTISSIERNSADTGFTLKWSASSGAKSYLIYGSHGTGAYSQLSSVTGTTATVNYSTLAANALYTFKIRAVGDYQSGLSNGARGLTPVKSVTVSSPSEGKVKVSYSGGDATSYQIGYAKVGSSYATVTTSATSYTFNNLAPGAKYNFYVKGFCDGIGSSPKKASCTVAKVGLSVSPGSKNVAAGESFKLTAKVTEGGVSWSSSNTNIATVDSTGKVTTKKAGTVVITAKSTKNTTVSASCEVDVKINEDPFHFTNIESIRFTKIPDPDGDFIIETINSKIASLSYFTAFDGKIKITYNISSSLKQQLKNDEKTYQLQLVKGPMEKSYHLGKIDADNLVTKGLITKDSAEYYGIWFHNGNVYYKYARDIEEYVAVMSVALSLNYAWTNYKIQKIYESGLVVSGSVYGSEVQSVEESIINQAKKAQTSGGYNADSFGLTLLKKGDKVVGLRGTYPKVGQSAWYTTEDMLKKAGYNTETINQGLQIQKNANLGYRSNYGIYEVQEDILVPIGKAINNPAEGFGGYTQMYIEKYDSVLKLESTFPLK